MAPGTTAVAAGTVRPPIRGIHCGNCRPHGRMRPSVSTLAATAPAPSMRPVASMAGERSSPIGANSGHGVSQDIRATA